MTQLTVVVAIVAMQIMLIMPTPEIYTCNNLMTITMMQMKKVLKRVKMTMKMERR